MRLRFVGVGSAFTMQNFHSNMLLEYDEDYLNVTKDYTKVLGESTATKRLMIDCGAYAPLAMNALGLKAKDVDALYISHLHADHIGGIEWFGFSRYFANLFDTNQPLADLYINETLVTGLWDSLKGGMDSHEGVVLSLEDFFKKVYKLKANKSFVWGSARLQPVQTVHVMNGYTIKPSYGLFLNPTITDPNNHVFITTDTQFCPNQIMAFYKRAKLIFQDAETAPYKSGVHAHYSDLKTLPAEIKAKMWLYHYNDGPLPNATNDGFLGFVEKGQVFEL